MKKIFKWIFRIILILLLIFVIYIAWNWSSFKILMGTEELSGSESPVPQTMTELPPLLEEGKTDWRSWYGPEGKRRSFVKDIRTDWSDGLEKRWEVNYLCQGRESASWSAPVVRAKRLIICGRDSENDMVFCLNPDNGALIWQASYPAKAKSSHGSGPRATPFIDEDRVYTFGRNGDMVCWSLFDGQKIWHKNVMDQGGIEPAWGHSSSPLVIDSLVLVQGGGHVRTVAYNKFSGDIVWKSGHGLPGYAALVPMDINEQQLVLAFHGTGLAAMDINTGKHVWEIPWRTDYDVNATTPLVIGDKIFISSGYGVGSMMLQTTGNTVDSLWRIEEHASIHSDPYYIDGYLYGYSGDSHQNKGAFQCLDPETGKMQWTTNEMGWGTCTWVDGYLLCCDIKGNLFLMKPSPERFQLVTQQKKALGKIPGPVWTNPLVANHHLYLRFKEKLVCYKIGQTPSAYSKLNNSYGSMK